MSPLLDAIHPNMKGNAPGKAPKNTDMGDIAFMGVYIKTYIIAVRIENNDNCVLIKFSISEPATRKNKPINVDWFMVNLPDGIGLFLVLFISLSLFFSNIWLNMLDEHITNKPPNNNNIMELKLISLQPNKYPIMEDMFTPIERRNLINCKVFVIKKTKKFCFFAISSNIIIYIYKVYKNYFQKNKK